MLFYDIILLMELIEYHVRIESFTDLSRSHETLINWQEEMCIVGIPQCWPEPISSEIVQVFTTLWNSSQYFLCGQRNVWILKSIFVLFLLQNCHWRSISDSGVMCLPYCLERPLKGLLLAEEGRTFPIFCHFLMPGESRWLEISLKNRCFFMGREVKDWGWKKWERKSKWCCCRV